MKYLYLHGFGSSPESRKAQFFKRKFKEKNINLLIPDLNGENFTELTLTSQIEIIKKILKSYKDSFVLIGSSLGGYISALCANSEEKEFKKIKKMILLAPAFEFSKRILKKDKEKFAKWQKEKYIEVFHYQWNRNIPLSFGFYLDSRKYESRNLSRQIPCLIFHGLQDNVVPFQVSIHYSLINTESRLILVNSEHSLLDQISYLWDETKLFLEI